MPTAPNAKSRKEEKTPELVRLPGTFCDEIYDEIERGHGFVPLIGAGLSAESGIPVGGELSGYLTLCIAKALGLDDLNSAAIPSGPRWHPVHGVWPVMEGNWVQEAAAAKDALINVAVHLRVIDSKDDRKETQPSGPLAQYQDVCRQAYGTLTDWRLALQFLARIKPQSSVPKAKAPTDSKDTQKFSVRVRYERFPELSRIYLDVLAPYLKDTPPPEPKPLTTAQARFLNDLWGDVRDMITHTAEQTEEQAKLADRLTDQVKRQGQIILGETDRHVIDSFFNHLVGGKSPNMGHRMLVHLIHAMRSRVILTVNFDDLLEQAAHEAKLDVGVLNVHHDAGLPPVRLLGNKPMIIKVHGAHYGLRADFTLDEAPSELDCRYFCSYLLPSVFGNPPLQKIRLPKDPILNHLFVVGVSGRDIRVRLLIQRALDAVPKLKVFWHCFSSRTEKELQEHFKDYPGRVIGVRHSRPGLLLLELYQRLKRSLPPTGLEYPATWYIPSPPRLTAEESENVKNDFENEIKMADEWLSDWRRSQAHSLLSGKRAQASSGFLITTQHPGSNGSRDSLPRWRINSLAWHLYEKWQDVPSQRCIWLDAEDLGDCFELKVRLLQSVARLSGRDVRKPQLWALEEEEKHGLQPNEANKVFLDELNKFTTGSGQSWVLFLNLRGAHGYNANSFKRLQIDLDANCINAKSPRAWLDDCHKDLNWEQEAQSRVAGLVNLLVNDSNIRRRFAVVVLHNEEDRFNFQKDAFCHRPPMLPKEDGWLGRRVTDAMKWMYKGTKGQTVEKVRLEKARLLRTITLLQTIQHRSAFVSGSILGLNPGEEPLEDVWQRVDGYIEQLIKKRILRAKPGGFLWTHWLVRECLRYQIIRDPLGKKVQKERSDLHFGLAESYAEFFGATADPLAIFQAVYHHCRGAQLCFRASHKKVSEDPNVNLDAVRARGALCQAANRLESARASIVSRAHPLDTRKCLDGYIDILARMIREELEIKGKSQTPRPDRIRSERNLRFLTMIKVRAQLYLIWYYRDIGQSDEVKKECANLSRWFKSWKQKGLWKLYEEAWPHQARLAEHWLAWEEAVVYISLRSYESAQKRLKELATLKLRFTQISDLLKTDKISEIVNDWIHNIADLTPMRGDSWKSKTEALTEQQLLGRFDARRLMIHVLRRMMELCLLSAEAESTIRDAKWQERRDELLKQGVRYYRAAQIIPRYIVIEEHSDIRIEQSRLHSVMAGILAKSGDHAGAHRHLSQASALLANLPESESIAHAVVELREIYCLFTRLEELKSLQNYRQKRLRIRHYRPQAKKLLRKDALKCQAWLTDILAWIRQVEQRMKQHRKSLWWWQTLCRYQMLHLEYSELIRSLSGIFRDAGLRQRSDLNENSTAHTRQIMEDFCRRVKFDAYQLARVAESYLRYSTLRGVRNLGFTIVKDFVIVADCLKRIKERWKESIEDVPPSMEVYITRVELALRQFANQAPKERKTARRTKPKSVNVVIVQDSLRRRTTVPAIRAIY